VPSVRPPLLGGLRPARGAGAARRTARATLPVHTREAEVVLEAPVRAPFL